MKKALLKLPIVLCVGLFWTNAANSQIFFTEDFEGVLSPTTLLPATWTETGLSTDGIYEVGDATLANSAGYWPAPAHTLFAQSNDDACNCDKSEDRLILPVQDFTSFTTGIELIADFYMDGNYGSTGFIEVSTDGGATWTVIHTMAANSAAWQDNSTHDLTAYVGLANVSIAFRFNDQASWATGLAVDNVRLNEFVPASFDVSMTAETPQYTQIPLSQVSATWAASGKIYNIGTADVTNATMTVNIFDGLAANVYSASSTPGSILAGDSLVATVPGFTPTLVDVYTVEHVVTITEADANIANDTVTYVVAVTDSTFARDNGIVANLLGVGDGATANVGMLYTMPNPEPMTSVSFFFAPGADALGDTVRVAIYDVAAGMPTTQIGQSAEHILGVADTVGAGVLLTLDVTDMINASLVLAAGTYYVAVQEYNTMDNMAIALTADIFTANTALINIDGGAYNTSESFGFAGAYIIRPNYGPTCAGTTGTLTAASCGDYTAPSGAVLDTSGIYTDIIANYCGGDSIITITLTVTALDLNVTEAGGVITSAAATPATYQWIDCTGGAEIAGETGQSFTPTVTGDYAVIITDGACSDTSACTAVTVGGLTDIAANGGVEVYPNPSNGTFNVSVVGVTTNAMSIEVLDMTGRIIETRTFDNVQGQLTTSISLDVEEGAYLVRISANGETAVQSVVISRK